MEGVTCNRSIATHLKALHEAKESFVEAESNEKLCCALKSNVREISDIIYYVANIEYYKWKDSDKWTGPETVIRTEQFMSNMEEVALSDYIPLFYSYSISQIQETTKKGFLTKNDQKSDRFISKEKFCKSL